jgi:hypothetical protein
MNSDDKRFFSKEKLFYNFAVALFVGSFVAWIAEIGHPDETKWWIFLWLWVSSFVVGVVLRYYDGFVQARERRFLWRDRLGIVRIFENEDLCKEVMKAEYVRSKKAKIFIVRGKSDFSHGHLFYDPSTLQPEFSESIDRKRKEAGGDVRVLLASRKSLLFHPFRNKARKTTTTVSEQKQHLHSVENSLNEIAKEINLTYRHHLEAFLVKFYLFDSSGFVVFNDHQRNLNTKSPVIQIEPIGKDEAGGIYAALDMYFEDVWTVFSEEGRNTTRNQPRKKRVTRK